MGRRVLIIQQRDIADCGAACLASVAAFYRLRIPLIRIRQYAGTDRLGTNVAGMIEAAERLGFQAKGVKGVRESLAQIPLPAIAHVKLENGLQHYVVIYKVKGKQLYLMDPGPGILHRVDKNAFCSEWTGVLILLMPGASFRVANEQVANISRFRELIRPHSGMMIQAALGALIYTILGLSASVYLQKIVDHVLTEGNIRLLNLLSVIMIGILIAQLVVGYVKNLFVLRTGQHIDARLIMGYYRHLLRLPQRFFDTMRVGEVLSRVNDAVKIRVFINDVAINLLVNIFTILFSLGFMFLYYWKLALVMIIILPFYGLIYFTGNRIHKKWQRRVMEDYAALETQLIESLNAAGTLKSFGMEQDAALRTERKFVGVIRSVYRSSIWGIRLGSTSEFVTRIFTVIMLWAGSYFVIHRELSPGELLSFYALIGYFTGPAMQLISAGRNVQEALIASDRLFEIMDLEVEHTGDSNMILTPELTGDIELKQVHFRHGSRTKVFSGLDMLLKKGSCTAVVGASGCGKSTLVTLLQRLYPVTEGVITIGGFNINHLTIDSLRRMISVVPQQVDLFATTIAENIAAGEAEPELQKVIRLARILGMHEFIERLPEHYFTLLEEGGVNLSGGQRQRLAIARALYREPEILILDEATASLDAASEAYVQQALAWYRTKGRTVIIIAHRLRTVMDCDSIIVLKDGMVAEQGRHEALMEAGGVYAGMW